MFVEPLTKLFNISITKGFFPNRWKVARVSLLFKDSAHDIRGNYRPISVLPVFSEILEKHVAGFFIDNNGEFLLILKLVFDLVDHQLLLTQLRLID